MILNKGGQKASAFKSALPQTLSLQGSHVPGAGDFLGRWRYLHSEGSLPSTKNPEPSRRPCCDQPTRKVHVTGHAVPVADRDMGGPIWAVG